MSVDLERQMREYAEFLRETAGVVEPEVVVGRATSSMPRRPSGWRRPALVAAAAAVGVLVLVGGVASLREPRESTPPVGTQQPVPTTDALRPSRVEVMVPFQDRIYGLGDHERGGLTLYQSSDGSSWEAVPSFTAALPDGVGVVPAGLAADEDQLVVLGQPHDRGSFTLGACQDPAGVPTVFVSLDGASWIVSNLTGSVPEAPSDGVCVSVFPENVVTGRAGILVSAKIEVDINYELFIAREFGEEVAHNIASLSPTQDGFVFLMEDGRRFELRFSDLGYSQEDMAPPLGGAIVWRSLDGGVTWETTSSPLDPSTSVGTFNTTPTTATPRSSEQMTTVLSIPGRIAAPHVGVGPDGHPVVLYAEIGEGQQEAREHRVARCTDPTCARDTETYPIPVDAGGENDAIWAALLPDGTPLLARRVMVVPETPARPGVFRDDLVVCDDPDCTSPTITTLDGAASGIAVGHEGLPVVLLHFPGEGDAPTAIVVRRCRDRQCSTFEDVMLGEREGAGRSTFLTVAPDGVPIAVYGRGGPPSADHGALLLTCRDPECRGAPVAVAVLDEFSGKALPAFDASGLPAMLFVDESETRMVSCLDRVCSKYTTIELGIGPAPRITSAIGFGGKLLLAWVSPEGTLNVAHCDSALCEAAGVDTGTLPAGTKPSPNVDLSITVPDDGLPVLVYGIEAPGEPPAGIALTKCGDPYCRP